jgi:hypothetical protein
VRRPDLGASTLGRMRTLPPALLLCLALAGCGSLPTDSPAERPAATTTEERDAAAAPTLDPGDPPSAAEPTADPTCGEEEQPPPQAGSHLIGDAEPPVPYSSTPPTSGWHSSGALEVTVHDESDPLSEPEQVSVLEADGVVVTYRDLAEEDVAALEELVRTDYDGRVAVTPYEALEPGQVALTAWGVLLRCEGLDLDAVRRFADAHTGEAVEPGHGH